VFANVAEAVAACVWLVERVEPDPGWRVCSEGDYLGYRRLYSLLRELRPS
jgi:hypothetical protein